MVIVEESGKERWRLKGENRKLARTVQELQHRFDGGTTQGQKSVLTNFTTLVNELQKTLRLELFSAVTSNRDKSNILIEENQPTVIMTCALKIGIKIYCFIELRI